MPSDHVDEPTLDEFTIPHVAFAAAEHYAVFPTAEKHELIQTLKRDVEGIHPSRAAGFWAPRVVTSVDGDR